MFARFAAPIVLASVTLAIASPASAAVDADAAQAYAKKNDCFKCHALDKTKKGPAFKKIAAKEKGKAGIEDKLFKHLTSSPKVKLEDGTEEEHKALDAKDQKEIKNLINWILSM